MFFSSYSTASRQRRLDQQDAIALRKLELQQRYRLLEQQRRTLILLQILDIEVEMILLLRTEREGTQGWNE